jgi:DNA (cytosine-5)-methyltransferase 1
MDLGHFMTECTKLSQELKVEHLPSDLDFATLRKKAGLSRAEAAVLLDRSNSTVGRYDSKPVRGSNAAPSLAVKELLRVIDERHSSSVETGRSFRFIDLFAGIGGLRIPFQEIGGQCVFTSEWDRYSQQTYGANYVDDPAEHMLVGDIREYSEHPHRVPDHDVLLAGFPCQPFSIAGVSKKNSLGRPHGFLCDTQGTLFYDVAEIIRYRRPSVFMLENVKNLQRHDGGRTFATIMHVLKEELGYEVHYRVINSAPWVPQKRERIFIVGFRDKSLFNFDGLVIPDSTPVLGNILEEDVLPKYTLSKKLWDYLKAYRAKHEKAGNGFGYSLCGPDDVARTLSARYYKDGSEILIKQNRRRPRRLTPRECSRLMGFDSPQGSDFVIDVSDTQAYRQFGNAVVVPVVRAVASLLRPHLYEALSEQPGQPLQKELLI